MARIPKRRELKIKKSIIVIGEGICEYYYLNSIKGIVNAHIKPLTVKDGIDYLETEVEKSIENRYENIFCLIDKDNKLHGVQKEKYDKFVNKYSKPIIHEKEESSTTIHIIENHPCLELWLFYYFQYTTSYYQSYENLYPLKENFLKAFHDYKKTGKYFESLIPKGGLHNYIIDHKKGDFNKALENSLNSMKHYKNGKNHCSFSEMKRLFDSILKDSEKEKLAIYNSNERNSIK